MWWLRWKIAEYLLRAAFYVMPRSQPRDVYIEAFSSVEVRHD